MEIRPKIGSTIRLWPGETVRDMKIAMYEQCTKLTCTIEQHCYEITVASHDLEAFQCTRQIPFFKTTEFTKSFKVVICKQIEVLRIIEGEVLIETH
jgi:hypothetical protein